MRLVNLVALLLAVGSCASPAAPTPAPSASPPPTVPAPASVDLSGSWSGTAADSQGPTLVSWQLSQAGAAVSGTVRTTATNPSDGSCSSCHRNKSGTVTGTLSGTSLMLTMTFAAGGDGDPTPECSATLNVTSTSVSNATVGSIYSGSDTCEGAFTNGTMTMRR